MALREHSRERGAGEISGGVERASFSFDSLSQRCVGTVSAWRSSTWPYHTGGQSTDVGNAGSGYSITAFGRQWLKEPEGDVFVPTEPERFAQLLEPFRERFGAGATSARNASRD